MVQQILQVQQAAVLQTELLQAAAQTTAARPQGQAAALHQEAAKIAVLLHQEARILQQEALPQQA